MTVHGPAGAALPTDDASAFSTSVFDAELVPMAEDMDGQGSGFRHATAEGATFRISAMSKALSER